MNHEVYLGGTLKVSAFYTQQNDTQSYLSRACIRKKTNSRHPVYASSCEEDLDALLTLIAGHHCGQPLTDEELRPFCWVDEPRDERHYLQRVWETLSRPAI